MVGFSSHAELSARVSHAERQAYSESLSSVYLPYLLPRLSERAVSYFCQFVSNFGEAETVLECGIDLVHPLLWNRTEVLVDAVLDREGSNLATERD